MFRGQKPLVLFDLWLFERSFKIVMDKKKFVSSPGVLGIRSCLASLESLETNLVPALTTLYLKETSSQIVLARLLVEHWNTEVKQLWQFIDGIIDPVALAQVGVS